MAKTWARTPPTACRCTKRTATLRQARRRQVERHVSGQELCEAARKYGLQQYGYLAPTVLAAWGIRRTDDIGEIVFNMIGIGQMQLRFEYCDLAATEKTGG